MVNLVKKIDGVNYLKCKECCELKELSKEFWYKHPEGFMGVLGRCKECIKEGRKTEKELVMARSRDSDRYYNNPKRREYILRHTKERRKRTGHDKIHLKTSRRAKKLGIRPEVCPICGKYHRSIEAHHFDYSQRNKIIFACSICHSKLDMGKIKPSECKIIDLLKI